MKAGVHNFSEPSDLQVHEVGAPQARCQRGAFVRIQNPGQPPKPNQTLKALTPKGNPTPAAPMRSFVVAMVSAGLLEASFQLDSYKSAFLYN